MKKPDPSASLDQWILLLEIERDSEEKLLREHFRKTCDSLNPVNIIRDTANSLLTTPGLTTKVVKAAIGLTAGIAMKKFLSGKTNNPVTRFLVTVLEMILAGKIATDADGIRSFALSLLKKMFKHDVPSEKI